MKHVAEGSPWNETMCMYQVCVCTRYVHSDTYTTSATSTTGNKPLVNFLGHAGIFEGMADLFSVPVTVSQCLGS